MWMILRSWTGELRAPLPLVIGAHAWSVENGVRYKARKTSTVLRSHKIVALHTRGASLLDGLVYADCSALCTSCPSPRQVPTQPQKPNPKQRPNALHPPAPAGCRSPGPHHINCAPYQHPVQPILAQALQSPPPPLPAAAPELGVAPADRVPVLPQSRLASAVSWFGLELGLGLGFGLVFGWGWGGG